MKVPHTIAILAVLIAGAAALPALAQTAKDNPLFETVIETKEAVYYTPAQTDAFKEANAPFEIFRSYPAGVMAAAKSDCALRNGELRTCGVMCGLNGCFQGCQLACVFPDTAASSTAELQENIAELTAALEETSDAKEQKSLARDLEGYQEKLARIVERLRHETQTLGAALSERITREAEKPAFALTSKGLVATTSAELRTVTNEWKAAREARFSQSCSRLTDPAAPVRNGFAAPFALADGGRDLLIDINCDSLSSDITVTAGDGKPMTYIYEKGYQWKNGKWVEFDWTPLREPATNGWLSGSAFADIEFEDEKARDASAVVAYICSFKDGAWQCGCTDGSCSKSRWQIQEVEVKE